MSTTTRPELSEANKYWIPKHRYYELRHFCFQYPEWLQQLNDIDGFASTSPGAAERVNAGRTSDLTSIYAEARMKLTDKTLMVEKACFEACEHQFWWTFLLQAVTQNKSYDLLEAANGIMPVSRNAWYVVYRRFFWTLDKMRE